MTRKRRAVLITVLAVLLPVGYGMLLCGFTEPWRVYGNDYRLFFWAIPAALGTVTIALIGLRFPWVLTSLALLVPLFLISRQQIINQRLNDSITSCANHSGFWGSHEFDGSTVLVAAEFADFLVEIHKGEPFEPLQTRRCPGFRRAGTRTGVVFVGGGLRLDSLRDTEVLIAFCSWKCHPVPYDHQHCLVWEWGEVNGRYRGMLRRNCSETTDMVTRIEKALKQADEGVVPYSEDASILLVEELGRRKELMHHAPAKGIQ